MYLLLLLSFIFSFSISAQETPEDPILRPGDSVFLSLPGESSLNITLPIKRNGNLLLPEIGDITVVGLTLSQASKKIKSLLGEVILETAAFELMLKERRLIISVLGYVKSPGTVDLAPDSTIQEAITSAKGLISGAQLNKMQVRRDGQVLRFDYKYYLDSGDGSKLPVLQSLDTIFVPASSLLGNVQTDFDPEALSSGDSSGQQSIIIFGKVIRPGAYDWSENLTLFDLITQAGGPSERASLSKLKILSRDDQNNLTTREFDMATFIKQGGSLDDIPKLKPRDTVIVPSNELGTGDAKSKWVGQSSEDSIYLMGEVKDPGRYLFNNNMHFLDILAAAKGPNEKADIHNIRITHRNGDDTVVTHLNLAKYFEIGDESLLPKVTTGDVIYVPNKERSWLSESKSQTIRVLGAVKNQGRYKFNQSMTILDLLAQAGGLDGSAQASNIVVVNGCCNKLVNNFDLIEFSESGDFTQLPALSIGDTVYVMHKEDSTWNQVLKGIQDTVGVLSVLKILSGG